MRAHGGPPHYLACTGHVLHGHKFVIAFTVATAKAPTRTAFRLRDWCFAAQQPALAPHRTLHAQKDVEAKERARMEFNPTSESQN